MLWEWNGMESRSVMEPAVLLLVSLPCTIGIELRSNVHRRLAIPLNPQIRKLPSLRTLWLSAIVNLVNDH